MQALTQMIPVRCSGPGKLPQEGEGQGPEVWRAVDESLLRVLETFQLRHGPPALEAKTCFLELEIHRWVFWVGP